jgi:uncharacterized protein involved in response to NO
LHREPYRLFFPLGVICGMAGVAIWPLYAFGVTATYSGRAHALVQTVGFLYSFVAGFLLTAIPRLTVTRPPGLPAQAMLAAAIIVSVVASERQAFALATGAFLVAHLLVVSLAATRYLRRQQQPPSSFVLVGLGLAAGLAGAIVNVGVATEIVAPLWDVLGRRLLTEGMMLLLVMGVGGFLGPRLLGFPPPATSAARAAAYAAAGVALLVSLVAEYGFNAAWMAGVRAVLVSVVMFSTMRLWQRPVVHTTLSWCIWTGSWLTVAGGWLAAAAPRYRADFLHVLFIGGFTVLILGVGTRVVLSHGGYGTAAEQRSWPLRLGLTFGLVAMLARLGAPFAPRSFFEHLAFAALFWLAAMLVWLVGIVGGAALRRPPPHPSP